MRDDHSPVFTVFGGTYVPESRGNRRPPEPKKGSTGVVTAFLGVLLIGVTTAAATTVKNRSHLRSEYAVPMQPMTPFIAKLPGTVGFEEALY
jgi:hypothetical protein